MLDLDLIGGISGSGGVPVAQRDVRAGWNEGEPRSSRANVQRSYCGHGYVGTEKHRGGIIVSASINLYKELQLKVTEITWG